MTLTRSEATPEGVASLLGAWPEERGQKLWNGGVASPAAWLELIA